MIVDGDVKDIVLLGLNKGSREDAIDEDGISGETVWGDVCVNDVEVDIDIGGASDPWGHQQSDVQQSDGDFSHISLLNEG